METLAVSAVLAVIMLGLVLVGIFLLRGQRQPEELSITTDDGQTINIRIAYCQAPGSEKMDDISTAITSGVAAFRVPPDARLTSIMLFYADESAQSYDQNIWPAQVRLKGGGRKEVVRLGLIFNQPDDQKGWGIHRQAQLV